MKRFAFLLSLLLCVSAHAQTVTDGRTLGSSAHTNRKLTAQVTSGSGANGQKAIGGTVQLPAGEFVWDQPVYISTGQKVIGQGTATRITWLGPPGTSAFVVYGIGGQPYVNGGPHVEDLQIDCTRGGDAIGIDAARTSAVKQLVVKDVTLRSGGIILPGEHYGMRIENVNVYEPTGYALRLDGQANAIVGLHVFGRGEGDKPLVEIKGSAEFGGFCWVEWYGNRTLLKIGPWISSSGYVHRGTFSSPGLFWLEQHPSNETPVKSVIIDRSDFKLTNYGGVPAWYIELKDATLRTDMPLNAGAVKGVGKVYDAGVERVMNETQK
jgi:hypothetical protein